MARDAVDHALGENAEQMPSVTHLTPLIGAEAFADARDESRLWQERFGWSVATVDHLLGRYGSKAREIVAICEEDGTMAQSLESAPRYLRAEVVYAATHEGALHLDDVLSRRTHIALELPERGVAAAEEVASILAPFLGWDEGRFDREISEYSALACAESYARELHDDRDATHVFNRAVSKKARFESTVSRSSTGWPDEGMSQ
jgi:glycerol-3-phosphate dehydrogenase